MFCHHTPHQICTLCYHLLAPRVFANAETLFYYARDARSTTKLLSPEEIQALLAQTKKKTNVNNLAFEENNQELTTAISEDVAALLSTPDSEGFHTSEGLCTTDLVQMNLQQEPDSEYLYSLAGRH